MASRRTTVAAHSFDDLEPAEFGSVVSLGHFDERQGLSGRCAVEQRSAACASTRPLVESPSPEENRHGSEAKQGDH